MAVFSKEDWAAYQMCSSVKLQLEEIYPDGVPLDPAEAEKLADNDLQMNWALTLMDWPTKREVLKGWFIRGAAHLSVTGTWVDDVLAQMDTPVLGQFDALAATVAAKIAEGGQGQFIAFAAKELIALLRMEDDGIAFTDIAAVYGVARVSHAVVRSAAKGSSNWRDETVAQNVDIMAVLQRDGLHPL